MNYAYSGRRVEKNPIVDTLENDEEDDEDPYKLCYPDEIYDTIDNEQEDFESAIVNRPPAPIPRNSEPSEFKECTTYISTGST